MLSIQLQYCIIIYYYFYVISFIHFSVYINHIFIVYSTELLGILISSFVSLYSLNILFTEKKSLWLINEFIKALEIKTSIAFNFVFANNTILSCLFFFSIIDLYHLIYTVIAQNFKPTPVLVIPLRIPAKKPKPEIETHSVAAEVKISQCST